MKYLYENIAKYLMIKVNCPAKLPSKFFLFNFCGILVFLKLFATFISFFFFWGRYIAKKFIFMAYL